MDMDMDIMDWLRIARQNGASDLHVASGALPRIRKDGEIEELCSMLLEDAMIDKSLMGMMTEPQVTDFFQYGEVDFSLTIPNLGRFRVNVYRQLNGISAVFRLIPSIVPTLEAISSPSAFYQFAKMKNGLVLIAGPTGCGKSTTLAAIVNSIIHNRKAHVLTIEDPIEFVHRSKRSIVSQIWSELLQLIYTDSEKIYV